MAVDSSSIATHVDYSATTLPKTDFSQGLNHTCTNSTEFLSPEEKDNLEIRGIPLVGGNSKGERQRSWYWIESNKEVGKHRKWMNKNVVLNNAEQYRREKQNIRIMLESSDGKLIFTTGESGLLSKRYMRKLLGKILRLKRWVKQEKIPTVMVTFTSVSKPNRSIMEDVELVKRQWNAMNMWLKRKMKHYRGYLGFLEVGHKTQMVHYHVVVFGAYSLPENKLKEIWAKYTGAFEVKVSKYSRGGQVTGGIDYAIKYVSKSVRGEIPESVSFVWATGRRLWSAGGIVKEMLRDGVKVEENKDRMWFAYIVDTDIVGAFEYDPKRDGYVRVACG